MAIGISDAHLELAGVARSFLENEKAHDAARALLEGGEETLPPFWDEMARLGWLGLAVPEELGGQGFGLDELLIVIEELGRVTAPGPFVSTVAVSCLVGDLGSDDQLERWLPALSDGSTAAALTLSGDVRLSGDAFSGEAIVQSASVAGVLAFVAGEDVVIVRSDAPGVAVQPAPSFDLTRRSARVKLEGVSRSDIEVIAGGAARLVALARVLWSTEAVGGARRCVEMSTEYAKQRQQFGRPIAMFQAVKHHCANMLVAAETSTAAVWDAARAHGGGDSDQFELAAAMACALAVPAFVHNAELNIQVAGGIGFTWEHDGHVLLRRAVSIASVTDSDVASDDVARLSLGGLTRRHVLELPPEAERYRTEARAAAEELASLEGEVLRARLIDTGYVQPHWPRPWGRSAPALEQLVIDEEFARAGVKRTEYGITGWVILTVIQHGSEDQVERFVRPTLDGSLIWCQLFSEPDAGSDAAGIRTRGERTDGGWLVTGQKVLTSGAQVSARGLATVRTDPSKPKHSGITMMAIDMHSTGVEVRPLREATGNAIFNEVFFDGVFVPDDDVVGAVDDGWTVARATLGNERVSIGGGSATGPSADVLGIYSRHGKSDAAALRELGTLLSERQAIQSVNLRRVERAVAGAGPGPEGNVTKLLSAEHAQRSADYARRLLGPEIAIGEGDGFAIDMQVLFVRALTIAGGTSEITRNQIGERILGLPRDPLVN